MFHKVHVLGPVLLIGIDDFVQAFITCKVNIFPDVAPTYIVDNNVNNIIQRCLLVVFAGSDDEPMYADELSMPIITTSQDRLYTITQNFSRQLRASDNGKSLICVGRHPGYPNGYSSVGKQLDIKCKRSVATLSDRSACGMFLFVVDPPQPQGNPIEIFGFTIGQPGTISIELSSNPKPHIEWTVRGQKISEGNTDPTGRIAATAPTELVSCLKSVSKSNLVCFVIGEV